MPRDLPAPFGEDYRVGDDSAFSDRSEDLTSDDEDLRTQYNAPIPPNGYIIDGAEMIEVDEIANWLIYSHFLRFYFVFKLFFGHSIIQCSVSTIVFDYLY